jgi:hypothetical protein
MRTDMTKLNVGFRHVVNAPKKKELQLLTGSNYLLISLFVVYLMSLQLKRYITYDTHVEVWPNLRCHRGTSGTNEKKH